MPGAHRLARRAGHGLRRDAQRVAAKRARAPAPRPVRFGERCVGSDLEIVAEWLAAVLNADSCEVACATDHSRRCRPRPAALPMALEKSAAMESADRLCIAATACASQHRQCPTGADRSGVRGRAKHRRGTRIDTQAGYGLVHAGALAPGTLTAAQPLGRCCGEGTDCSAPAPTPIRWMPPHHSGVRCSSWPPPPPAVVLKPAAGRRRPRTRSVSLCDPQWAQGTQRPPPGDCRSRRTRALELAPLQGEEPASLDKGYDSR